MRVIRWIGIAIGVLVLCVGALAIGARFSDGPIAMFPGGPFQSGEWVEAERYCDGRRVGRRRGNAARRFAYRIGGLGNHMRVGSLADARRIARERSVGRGNRLCYACRFDGQGWVEVARFRNDYQLRIGKLIVNYLGASNGQ